MLTRGFISGENALPRGHDPLGNITEFLLLLRAQEGVGVRHGDPEGGNDASG